MARSQAEWFAPPRATQGNFGLARLTVSPQEGSTTRCAIATSPSPLSQAPERNSCRLWYAEAGRAGAGLHQVQAAAVDPFQRDAGPVHLLPGDQARLVQIVP